MYVLSVIDKKGEERTFVATHLSFELKAVTATVNSLEIAFRLEHVLDVAEVADNNRAVLSIKATHHLGQRVLS